jgi:hypothetical protein
MASTPHRFPTGLRDFHPQCVTRAWHEARSLLMDAPGIRPWEWRGNEEGIMAQDNNPQQGGQGQQRNPNQPQEQRGNQQADQQRQHQKGEQREPATRDDQQRRRQEEEQGRRAPDAILGGDR